MDRGTVLGILKIIKLDFSIFLQYVAMVSFEYF